MTTDDLTTEVWDIDADDFPADGPIEDQARFLLRYAILAPSSHNSQPWEFAVGGDSIEVHAVEDRWLDVADRDKRELYISFGCAIENFCLAAEHFEFDPRLEYYDDAAPVAVITLVPDTEAVPGRSPQLFDELTERRTNHHLFEDRPLPDGFSERLRECVLEETVTFRLIDDPDRLDAIAELQAEADRRQMEDPEYRKELGYWVGIGALGDSWLKARLGQAVVTHLNIGGREARKNSKLVRSAPAIGLLETPSDDPTARLKTGQVFERLALVATAEGIAVHPMSQILERPETREVLAGLVPGDDMLPQHLFRLGYPTETDQHTPRWPLTRVLVEGT